MDPMPKSTVQTAKAAPVAERKARLQKLVSAGKLKPAQAKLIDFREPGPAQRAAAQKLVGKGHEALAREARTARGGE